MVVYITSLIPEIIGKEARKFLVDLLVILYVGFINPLVQIIPSDDRFFKCYPTPTVAFYLVTLNTACGWSKLSPKKNILSIAKVVTFELMTKFWGMEY